MKFYYYSSMSFLKKILAFITFLFSLNVIFIENTYSKEKVIDGINNLIFKFPKHKNFVSKYNCITKFDKNKNPSSFIYEIGQNQMKMRAGDIATLLIDLKSRTYSFAGYKLNEKDKSFLKEQNFDEIVQTVLSVSILILIFLKITEEFNWVRKSILNTKDYLWD